MDRSGMWNTLTAWGHKSVHNQIQFWITAYLCIGDFKQIGNIGNNICNLRKVMLM